MATLAGVRALAFDLDNTLIDFTASREAGLRAVLARIESEGHPLDRARFLERHRELTRAEDARYLADGTWRPTQERFAILCKEFGIPADGFARALTDTYQDERHANLRPYPEALATLASLQERLPLYLVTNGPAAHQHREIEVTGVARYFRRMFVCEDYAMRKPDPRVFEMIRREAGVREGEMLIAGDNPVADIDRPRRLGWRTVWVVRDARERANADRGRADAVVAHVGEIVPLLGL